MRRELFRVLACGCGLALVLSTSGRAQERPVVFVHGVGSGPETWAAAAERLRARLEMAPERARVSWSRALESQGDELQAAYGRLPGSTVAIGHSLGGIASREWSKRRSLDGLVTVGSPNYGAPIANHINEWVGFNYSLFGAVGFAFTKLGNVSYDVWYWIFPAIEAALNWGGFVADFSIKHLVIEMGMQLGVPFVQQIPTGSPYLADLNSNLGREAAQVPNRVGIVNTASQYWTGGPFRLKDPDGGAHYSILTSVSAAALDYWGFRVFAEADPLDHQAQALAFGLWDAAFWLWNFDEFWCRAISDERPLWSARCWPNDGFIPTWSQYYPGASLNVEIQGGPVHTRETAEFDEALFAVLTGVMHVPPRVPGGPDGPPPSPEPGPLPLPSPTPPPPGPDAPPGGGPDSLVSHQRLYEAQSITSGNGQFYLYYQADGNLVAARSDGVVLWQTRTSGTLPGDLLMQGDGNLVLRDAFGRVVWASGTPGHDGAYLVMQNDGNLVLYNVGGNPIWATGTRGF